MTTNTAHLTRALAHARRAAGISTQQLATTLGVSRQAVSTWENSDGGVHLSTLSTWASALGYELNLTPVPAVGPGRLLDGSGQPVCAQPSGAGARHVIITGPDRGAVARAALEEYPVDLVACTSALHQDLPMATARHLGSLPTATALAAVALDVPEPLPAGIRETIDAVLRPAKAPGRVVYLLAEDLRSVPQEWVRSAAMLLHADAAIITVTQADRVTTWHLEPVNTPAGAE